MSSTLHTVPLHDFHLQHCAKMGPFAGYTMPLSYARGSTQEHLHTREHASLFDVSHMGQIHITGDDVVGFLERLLPICVFEMPLASCKYTVMLNEAGGIIDDVILTRKNTADYHLVINAACKEKDIAHIHAIAQHYKVQITQEDKVLVALQGPKAESIVSQIWSEASTLMFMQGMELPYADTALWINRSGYTGEDGFEISASSKVAVDLVTQLTHNDVVACAGLASRDSLRLEAGLALYGNDMDETINPVEANLKFTVSKKRREHGGFVGDTVVCAAFSSEPCKIRIGLRIAERIPIRAGAKLFADKESREAIGWISSGAITPSVGYPICFGYVPYELRNKETIVWAERRENRYKAVVSVLPFVAHKYKK